MPLNSSINVRRNQTDLKITLMVTYHLFYGMNKFVTNKSKLPQDGAQIVSLYGVIGYHVTHVRAIMWLMWGSHDSQSPHIKK